MVVVWTKQILLQKADWSIALIWSIAFKLSHQSSFLRKIETADPKISDEDTAAQ